MSFHKYSLFTKAGVLVFWDVTVCRVGFLNTWRLRQNVPSKRWDLTPPHIIISEKTRILNLKAILTSHFARFLKYLKMSDLIPDTFSTHNQFIVFFRGHAVSLGINERWLRKNMTIIVTAAKFRNVRR